MTTNQVAITFGPVAVRSYFGGRLVGQQLGSNDLQPVVQDRLGSVGKYYPYGEERNSPQLPNDQVKFATYTRDSATGNDYADQRYYTSVLGRFMTADTSFENEDASDPGSWNAYSYSEGDPVNFYDPTGAATCADSQIFDTLFGGGYLGTLGSLVNGTTDIRNPRRGRFRRERSSPTSQDKPVIADVILNRYMIVNGYANIIYNGKAWGAAGPGYQGFGWANSGLAGIVGYQVQFCNFPSDDAG